MYKTKIQIMSFSGTHHDDLFNRPLKTKNCQKFKGEKKSIITNRITNKKKT